MSNFQFKTNPGLYDKNNFFDSHSYQKIKHKSGLTIILSPMPEYSYSYAVMGVKYGSVNNEFKKAEDEEFLSFPQGIAHFLEHKMFENEDGEDTFQKFARTGAMANAYTGFDQTCYLFSCSQNFKESLKILLEYLSEPYFTDENVEKEKGIIEQEIKMCQDNPSWRCYFEVIRGLYSKIPVIYDIAGTQESIRQITKNYLYQCYDMFYNLHNMVLSVAGNFETKEVLEVVDQVLGAAEKQKPVQIVNKNCFEPIESVTKKTVLNLPVEISLIKIGFKHLSMNSKKQNFVLNLKYSLLNELISGAISNLYSDLYYSKVISRPISYEVISGESYLASIFSVSSKEPEIVEQKFFEEISKIKKNGISEKDFEIVKKSFYGRHVFDMDSPETVATNHMDGYLDEVDFTDWQDIIMNINKSELEKLLKESYNYESSSVSIINPIIKNN